MPQRKPYRKIDKYWNEKQLARDFGSGLNDVIGRGALAGLLGAPADIMNLGENGIRGLLGLPQVTAWGGSEHIGQELEKAGLVSSVRRPKTELLASLISPSATAKTVLNAPKTARMALKALDNLDAPNSFRRGLGNSQVGAIDVWHGSPHKFDEFKAMDNIGGGEGAQAYGHGGYHASNKDVAQGYKDKLSGGIFNSSIYLDGVKYEPKSDIEKRALAIIGRDGIGSYKQVYSASKRDGIHTDGELSEMKRVLDFAKGKEVKSAVEDGSLYRNQLRWPDPAREAADPLSDKHFLDWDKPLSEQDASVQSAIRGNYDKVTQDLKSSGLLANYSADDLMKFQGGDYYDMMRQIHGDKQVPATQYLLEQGIPGIRYLDGGSRSAGQGSHNYVTFDDALVNIMERNGQPVGNLAKMVAPQDEALRVAQANAAKPVSEGGLGLRLDNTPEERASAMGFDTPQFHATQSKFDDFSVTPNGRDIFGIHMGTPDQANDIVKSGRMEQKHFGEYKPNSSVMPLLVKDGNLMRMPDMGAENSWDIGQLQYQLANDGVPLSSVDSFNPTYAGVRQSMQDAGYDGIRYENAHEGLSANGSTDSVMLFDPKNIRSRFAAFDPMRKDSSDLLAGLAPLGLGALIAQPKEKKKPKK